MEQTEKSCENCAVDPSRVNCLGCTRDANSQHIADNWKPKERIPCEAEEACSILLSECDKRQAKGNWYKGLYLRTCTTCAKQFTGGRTATSCAPCAYRQT